MRPTIDHDPARAADPFAAIVFEGDRLLALAEETLVENVEHFQE